MLPLHETSAVSPAARVRVRPEAEPVVGGDVVLRDRHEAGEARLGGEEVVVGGVEGAGAVLVADGEELPLLVEEEAEVHLGRVAVRALRERLEAGRQSSLGSADSSARCSSIRRRLQRIHSRSAVDRLPPGGPRIVQRRDRGNGARRRPSASGCRRRRPRYRGAASATPGGPQVLPRGAEGRRPPHRAGRCGGEALLGERERRLESRAPRGRRRTATSRACRHAWRTAMRCPARFPLSTVETYAGSRTARSWRSYQLKKWPR